MPLSSRSLSPANLRLRKMADKILKTPPEALVSSKKTPLSSEQVWVAKDDVLHKKIKILKDKYRSLIASKRPELTLDQVAQKSARDADAETDRLR